MRNVVLICEFISQSYSFPLKKPVAKTVLVELAKGYFICPYSIPRDPKYQFSDSTEIRLAHNSMKYSCNWTSGSHASQSSFSEIFFLIMIRGYFHWPYSLPRDPKYQFSDSTEISLAHNSTKNSCNWMSASHTTQSVSQKASFQFLTEKISFFTKAIYRFPNITLQIPQEQS